MLETKTKQKIYWSRPSKLRIDNYVKERKGDSGVVIERAQAIEFENHMCITSDLNKQKYIESSDSYRSNTCVLVKDFKEAVHKTHMQNLRKLENKTVTTTDESNVHLEIKPDGVEYEETRPFEENA